MTILLLIYLILYLSYCTYKKGKTLQSFSLTAYILKSRIWFCFTFWLVGLGLFYPLSLINLYAAIVFTISIMGVGITPFYKSNDLWLHFGGGYLSAIACQIIVCCINPWFLSIWILYIIYLVLKLDSNKTFWAELTCFTNTFAALIYKNLIS